MATSKDKEDNSTTRKLLWIAGTAGVTAFAMFYVNRHLNEREEYKKMRLQLESQGASGGSSDD